MSRPLRVAPFVLAAAIAPAPAAGDDIPAWVRLLWSAPPGCPSAERLVDETSRWMGRRAFVPPGHAAHYVVQGSVERPAPRRWIARLTLRRPDGSVLGTRELRARGPSCRPLARLLPVVLALLTNLRAPRLTLRLPPPRPIRTRPRAPLLEAGGGIFLEASLGAQPVVPSAAFSVRAVLGSPHATWWSWLALWWMPTRSAHRAGGEVGIGYRALQAGLCLGRSLGDDLLHGPCLALSLGHSERWGRGFERNRYEERAYTALEAGHALRWRSHLPWLGLEAAAGVRWVPWPARLLVTEGGSSRPVFTAPPLEPWLRVGVLLGMGKATSTR